MIFEEQEETTTEETPEPTAPDADAEPTPAADAPEACLRKEAAEPVELAEPPASRLRPFPGLQRGSSRLEPFGRRSELPAPIPRHLALVSRPPLRPPVAGWESCDEFAGFVSRFIAFHVKRKWVCVK